MAPILDRHPVRVAVNGDKSEPGFLIFADGVLVAVLSHLEETVDGALQNDWYIEAGFGRCDGIIPNPSFKSQEDAERWCPGTCWAALISNRGATLRALNAASHRRLRPLLAHPDEVE